MVLVALLLAGRTAGADAPAAADAAIEGIPLGFNLQYECGRTGQSGPAGGGVLRMADEVAAVQLQGRWVHSHEEDAGGRLVFRPPEFEFPPSRGRTGFNLAADGTVQVDAPGADDRGAASAGRWTLKGNRLTITAQGFTGAFEIESVDEDRLVLRRRP